jgi:hypothetical protein
MKPLLIAGAVLACTALWSGSAQADAFTAAGFSFSDELGGFRLISASGAGTIADPIVVVEEITQLGPAVLVVRGAQLTQHQGQQSMTFSHLAVIKIVINGTGRVWTGFELELQEILKQPSPYLDGLSFDQMGIFAGKRFQSDRFTTARRVTEPYDRVWFHGGAVDPGEAVRFNFYITDPTPKREFFLLQEPQLLLAGLPEGDDVSGLAADRIFQHYSVIALRIDGLSSGL